jgi:epoxyqueuosine reductase
VARSDSIPGESIVRLCLEAGFARAGVCEAAPSEHEQAIRQWIGGGRHGEMAWLADRLEERLDPERVVPGVRSIILVADQYASREDEASSAPVEQVVGEREGGVARYARGRDYHKVIKKRLHSLADALRAAHPEHAFRAFTDTAPVLEREHAVRAGMGWIGKHTLLIDPDLGSYLLLGGILTTLPISPPATQRTVADHCGTCTRCLDACPTDAITPYSVDATRCISYLTIEHRSPIEPSLHEPMGKWLFGCDICQEVCPHNAPRRGDASRAGAPNPAYEATRPAFDVLETLRWTEEDRREAFTGSAMKRARLDMMKRNALIVAGNILREREDHDLRARIRSIAEDLSEPDLVRTTAADVLRSLGDAPP